MAKITYKTMDGNATTVEAENGETLLEAANRSGVKLFGGCGGAGVCGTCHVLIDEAAFKLIKPAEPEEADLLEILPGYKPDSSRLACQVEVTDKLDGITVIIP